MIYKIIEENKVNKEIKWNYWITLPLRYFFRTHPLGSGSGQSSPSKIEKKKKSNLVNGTKKKKKNLQKSEKERDMREKKTYLKWNLVAHISTKSKLEIVTMIHILNIMQ